MSLSSWRSKGAQAAAHKPPRGASVALTFHEGPRNECLKWLLGDDQEMKAENSLRGNPDESAASSSPARPGRGQEAAGGQAVQRPPWAVIPGTFQVGK